MTKQITEQQSKLLKSIDALVKRIARDIDFIKKQESDTISRNVVYDELIHLMRSVVHVSRKVSLLFGTICNCPDKFDTVQNENQN